MSIQQIRTLFTQLKTEFDKGNSRSVPAIEKLLEKLKVEFITASFLPLDGEKENLDLLVIQRDTLEYGVLTMIAKRDKSGFYSAMAQLKHYYNDVNNLKEKATLESKMKYQMLGLNLMYLLAENKLPEFHMELERLPTKIVNENVFISTPVQLEQYLMEGTYNKIFLSKSNVPSPYYSYFMEILLDTVRDEISSCIEKAYDSLSVREAARLLFFDGDNAIQEAQKYAQKKNWRLNDNKGYTFINEELRKQDEHVVDSDRLATQYIFYAKQLEMIV